MLDTREWMDGIDSLQTNVRRPLFLYHLVCKTKIINTVFRIQNDAAAGAFARMSARTPVLSRVSQSTHNSDILAYIRSVEC